MRYEKSEIFDKITDLVLKRLEADKADEILVFYTLNRLAFI